MSDVALVNNDSAETDIVAISKKLRKELPYEQVLSRRKYDQKRAVAF